MLDEYLKIKKWSAADSFGFFDDLNDYFDEDKCEIICKMADELIKRGGKENCKFAGDLLIYATQHCFDVEDTNIKATVYYRLGKLFEEKTPDYKKAYTYYGKYALNNTVNGNNAIILTRAILLRDNFTFSDELEKELLRSYGEPDLGLRQDRLYETIANYIVAKHYNKEEQAEKYRKQILAIYKADEIFVLDLFLKKDDIRDVLEIPEATTEFIESLKTK